MARIYFVSEVSAFSTFSADGKGTHKLSLSYSPREGVAATEIWSNEYTAPASGLNVCDLASIVENDLTARGLYSARYTLKHEHDGKVKSETYAVIPNSCEYGVTAEEWLRTHFLVTAHHVETVHAHRLAGMPPSPYPSPRVGPDLLQYRCGLSGETAKVTTTYLPEDSDMPVSETVTEYLAAGINELTLNPGYSAGKSPMYMHVAVGERTLDFVFEPAGAHAGLLIQYRNPFNHPEPMWLRGQHSYTVSAESTAAVINRERRRVDVRDTTTYMLTASGLPHILALMATWLLQSPKVRLLPVSGSGAVKDININEVSGDVNTSPTDLNTIKLTYQSVKS